MDELAHIVERHPPAPRSVNRAQAIERRLRLTGKTKAQEDVFEKMIHGKWN
jgi:hypothetical protein